MEKMFEFAKLFAVVMKTFPQEERERDRLPRDYVANVIFTIVGKPFQEWVNVRVEARHQLVAKQEDQIMMDESIARFFNASTSTSGK